MARRTTTVGTALCGALALCTAGLYIDPRTPSLPRAEGPPGLRELPHELPELLRRHLDPAGGRRGPDADTLAIVGRARMRPGGRGPVVPLRFRTNHRVGLEFVAEIAMTWFGCAVVQGLDGFVAGQGISRIGSTVSVGPEVDQAANLFLWSEATCVPGVWARTPGLAAEQQGDDRLQLQLPYAHGSQTAELTFRGGVPIRFSGDRHKGAGVGLVPWSVDYLGWRRIDGIPIPTSAEVRWWDEPAPWFRVDITAAIPNADVSGPLAAARCALRTHRTEVGGGACGADAPDLDGSRSERFTAHTRSAAHDPPRVPERRRSGRTVN